MDTESPRINEEFLHGLIEHSDTRLMAMVGMEALHTLALQMPTEKFKVFIEGAVRRAAVLGQRAGLQPKQSSDQQPDQTAAVPQQPTPAQ